MTRYGQSLLAFGFICMMAALSVFEFGELAFSVILAAALTWKLYGHLHEDRYLPDSRPVSQPPRDTFSKRFALENTETYQEDFLSLLSPGDDYDDPEEAGVTAWMYEPESLACRILTEDGPVRVAVGSHTVGNVPAACADTVAAWQREGRITQARVSFYGGPYRRIRNGAVQDCSVPFSLQVTLKVRKRDLPL